MVQKMLQYIAKVPALVAVKDMLYASPGIMGTPESK
jgi:hypothetical protein